MLKRLLFAAALVLLAARVAHGAVWVLPAWQRLTPTSTPAADYAGGLCLARGEAGSVQVAVSGAKASYPVTWAASADLAVTAYAEAWTYTAKGATHYYPDGLRPLAQGGSLTLDSSKPGAVWFDVRASRTASPGTYAVSMSVAGVTKQIGVTVWAFALPESPTLKSAIGLWPSTSTRQGARGKLAAELLLLDNRLQATFVDPTHSAQLAAAGQTQAHVGGYASTSGQTVTTPPLTATSVAANAAKYSPLNPYIYVADEVYDPTLLANLDLYSRAAVGRAKRMMTTRPELATWLDVTAALPKFVTDALVAGRLAAGREVWLYQTLSQDSYSPKWLLDRGYPEHALMAGFLPWRYRLTGLLYWRVDNWPAGYDVWAKADGYSATYPGEALWILPLPDGSYAPTMRLKYLRDGVDDYDYLALLRAQGQGAFADHAARSVAPDWTNWSRDGAAIEAARRQLGQRLHLLHATVTRSDSWSVVVGGAQVGTYADEASAFSAAEALLRAGQSGIAVVRTSALTLR